VLTLSEAAEYLRMSEQSLHEAAILAIVPGRLIVNQWRFSRDTLRDWISLPTGETSNLEIREKDAHSNGVPIVRPGFSDSEAEKKSLLSVIGSMADDETWEPMVEEIYRERTRHPVGELP
jgi:hypothetical protein